MTSAQAHADLMIVPAIGSQQPTPFAAPDFAATSPDAAKFGQDIAAVISVDLERSGLAGQYGTPVWPPQGDLIAFSKTADLKTYIGLIAPDGSQERLLAAGSVRGGPTWAPHGRVLARETKAGPRLFTIDVQGFNERPVETPVAAFAPNWSPLIP